CLDGSIYWRIDASSWRMDDRAIWWGTNHTTLHACHAACLHRSCLLFVSGLSHHGAGAIFFTHAIVGVPAFCSRWCRMLFGYAHGCTFISASAVALHKRLVVRDCSLWRVLRSEHFGREVRTQYTGTGNDRFCAFLWTLLVTERLVLFTAR